MKPDPSSPARSIVKALTWETFSTLATFGVAWLMFGSLGTCITFAAVTFLMKLVLFFGHERLWHQVRWGKSKEQLCMEAIERGEYRLVAGHHRCAGTPSFGDRHG